MRQYREMKASAPGTLLLFRVGDFYETFDEDAVVASKELGITLTKRNNGGDMTPLAGFPHHAVDSYLPKLVRKGYRVAVCEQTEDPETAKKAGKKIVSREITEITTPGVTLSEHVLNQRRNNYILSLVEQKQRIGFAFADISTGEFALSETDAGALRELLTLLQPAELLLPPGGKSPRTDSQSGRDDSHSVLKNGMSLPMEYQQIPKAVGEAWIYGGKEGYTLLTDHFGTHSLKGFGVDELELAHVAGGALLEYLRLTQKTGLKQLRTLSRFDREDYMSLDTVTKRNLELITRAQDGEEEGSLISILDETVTAMGSRLLRKWVVRPLLHAEQIQERHARVEQLYSRHPERRAFREALDEIADLERLISRISSGRTTPRDLGALRSSLRNIPKVIEAGKSVGDGPIHGVLKELKEHPELLERLESGLQDELPQLLRDGGVIRDGVSDELDELRSLAKDSKKVISGMRDAIVQQTGISSLKIGYNKVFGYYIEVTKARKEPIPENFIRKQTLVNAERYITPELKEIEEKILGAEERIIALEEQLFEELRLIVAEQTEAIQKTASILAELDVLQCFAEVSFHNGYVKPVIDEGSRIEIKKGRHPVVEKILGPQTPFIPNDLVLDHEKEQILIITGPNMAGKSVILRQAGLIVLMAQIGCFVPAAAAHIGVVDKIFTRVGASDNLASGESTFLVEMNETANILNNATNRSLILLDEIGRGTSTFDGLSIAWALAEYLHNEAKVAAKTLFATHYHELNELAARYPRIRNYNVSVKEHEGNVIFLRKLVEGGADHSYGIQVAALAGLPGRLLERAREVLRNLESHTLEVSGATSKKAPDLPAQQPYPEHQMTLFAAESDPVVEQILDRLEAIETDRLTPLEALVLLGELKKLLK